MEPVKKRINGIRHSSAEVSSHYTILNLNCLSSSVGTITIINVHAMKGPMNISVLTWEVAEVLGKTSKVTVWKRVLELVEEGVIERGEGYSYRLVE